MQTYYEKFNKNFRTIFIAFYKVYPSYSGVSEVSKNFFESWPTRKKIFYFPYNLTNSNNLFLLKIFSFFFKIIFLLITFIKIKFIEIPKSKKNLIIIEGASWIFFSFFFIVLCKVFLNKIKIIYHSHNVEYEVRTYKKNFLITIITKILEKKVFEKTISTVVSEIDQKKIFDNYRLKPYILFNGINEDIKFKKKIVKNFQIIFPGNYDYYFNYISINILTNEIIPFLLKKFPKIKLVITGSKKVSQNFTEENIQYKGFLKRKKYLNILQSSNLLIYPATKAPGTKFKIIEAICHGLIVITTKEGLKGISAIKNTKSILIYKNYKQLEQLITKCFKNIKNIKKHAYKDANYYKKIYRFKNINNKFINNYLLEKL
jgi:hypothetical protein